MVEKLSDEETALSEAVAYWLREEMISQLVDASPAPDLLYDLAQSNYEIICSALERAGLLAYEGHYWPILEPNKEELSLAISTTRSKLDHVLDGLACHSVYVSDLYRHFEAVTPSSQALREVCVAMTAHGYMEATSKEAFEWTNNFGPWLVRHGAWDLDEFEPASQDEVKDAMATIPHEAMESLSGSICRHKPHFVRCFFAQWVNGKWEEREWRNAPSDDWDLNLAAGLYSQLHS